MENIYKALVKFQEEFKGMKADSSNPFFKSTYISLDGIIETVRPLLAKNGLAVIQEATGDGEFIFVKTKIIHVSGEEVETDLLKMKPTKNDPQAMGSCITYSKRYQLAALLGICESIDDDGNTATYGINKPNNKKEDKGSGNKTGNLTDAQVKRLYSIAHSKNIAVETVKAQILKKFNKKVDELTKEEYDLVCKGYESIQTK